MPPPEPVEYRALGGILCLSHKYDVKYLHRRALQHLAVRLYFPSVEAYRSSRKYSIEEPWHIKFSGSYVEPDASELLSIIKLCKRVGADWLLPMAYYYACCHLRQVDLLSMTSKEDGHHSRVCLYACRYLIANKVAAFGFLKPNSRMIEDCLDRERCQNLRQGLLSGVLGTVLEPLDVAPLDSWREDRWEELYPCGSSPDPENPTTFCVPCYQASKTMHSDFLRECWDKIPSFFCLASWSELERVRQTALGESITGETIV
jgi:hypothetical protein